MSDELYEELFGPESPPTAPSSVATAPSHGEFERDETPEVTDADGVDKPQVPAEDSANAVTRCPSTLGTPPPRALGGAAELAGSPSSTATPPVALGVAGHPFKPVLPLLPPYPGANGAQRQLNASRPLAPPPQHAYRQAAPPFFQGHSGHGGMPATAAKTFATGYASAPRTNAAQRGASLPHQLNASRPVAPLPQHAYGQDAAPLFQGHGGYGGMPPATAPQTFAAGYASAPHITQSNGIPYTGPTAHHPLDPAAYAYAVDLRMGSLAPASGSRGFPGAAQLNYPQPKSQYTGQFYGPLYAGQEGAWGGATTAWPTAARQPVPADSRPEYGETCYAYVSRQPGVILKCH
ncbi:hypothetical protein GGX14DRAFT_560974 [Mycena pura]|uniref:Uncharacterized protein n=1 Tax=Mycena pura TaxID=153505 RepID=A0AAD6YJF1_9AGAR|nr:hypothetical protein GGX14DRAFT_560974 [Mycena pura]